MKIKNYAIIFLLTLIILRESVSFSQPGYLILTFSGDNNSQPVNLESVMVKNLTQNCDTTLYPPDLTLVIDTLLTNNNYYMKSGNNFKVLQNYPNPFTDRTKISVLIPENDNVEISVNNLFGQQVAFYSGELIAGSNNFIFSPGKERIYVFSARYMGEKRAVQMIALGKGTSSECNLKFQGIEDVSNFKSLQFKNYFDFNPGDQLLYVGYSELGESGMSDTPESDNEYTLQFATNIPCINESTVDYGGQVYNTIQIYSQCWLKENLNVGTMIPSSQTPSNNNIIEKYCMADDEYYCNNFAGGLYFSYEMMNYTNQSGGQGICPDGWHVPDDLDWQILEGVVDSEFGVGDEEWGNYEWRGSDAGGNLKQTGTANWEPPNTGATDAFGFSAIAGGYFIQGDFWGPMYKGLFWSSSANLFRNMDWEQKMVRRDTGPNSMAISVRCVKDDD